MEWRKIPNGQLNNIKALYEGSSVGLFPKTSGPYYVGQTNYEALQANAVYQAKLVFKDYGGVAVKGEVTEPGMCSYCSALVRKFIDINGGTANVVCVTTGGNEHFFVTALTPGNIRFVVDLTCAQFPNGPDYVVCDAYGVEKNVPAAAKMGGESLRLAYKMAIADSGLKKAKKAGAMY